MKRYAVWLALVSMSLSPLALPAQALAASTEAKKFCSDQWNTETKAKTIPRGMTKEKYMRQCTANYTANHTAQTTAPATDTTTPQQPNSAAAWPPAPSTTPGSN